MVKTNFDATVLNLKFHLNKVQRTAIVFQMKEQKAFQQRKYVFIPEELVVSSSKFQLAADEEFVENPEKVKLFNATKISGRTKKV